MGDVIRLCVRCLCN